MDSFSSARAMGHNLGEVGSGAGKGGGAGGSVRDAGGAFGKMEAAREEEYFHKLVRYYLIWSWFHLQFRNFRSKLN